MKTPPPQPSEVVAFAEKLLPSLLVVGRPVTCGQGTHNSSNDACRHVGHVTSCMIFLFCNLGL